MRGDDHVVLSMATALLCISPFLAVDLTVECLWGCVFFMVGVYGGSRLPDADVAATKGLHPRNCRGLLFSGISIVIISVVRVIYRLMGLRFNRRHRHSLHTIFGVFVAVCVIGGLTGIILVDGGWWSDALYLLYAGILCGGFLHLAEDCCTVTGLNPFMPFSSLHLNGAINTGDYGDRRPVLYAKFLVCMAALVIAGGYVYHVPAGNLFIPVLAFTVVFWFIFYRFSQYLHA
ncbi:metal-dependent hydrolase [Methanogenium marinum]|uniref:Metal-dependent hydrolase n=1 Tax=Methanogenium marinum TaxID=348610 RepID=A0A9Q4KT85_9EURY|nr:metal-dependent hydrolase [Methanogenium marinum]MDE4908281.1 metal-dependent hydrolase [Methanogenium marinum]